MTRILGLVLLVTLLGSGAAWPRTLVHKPPHPHAHKARTTAHTRTTHTVRRGPVHHRSRAAALAASGPAKPHGQARFQEEASGAPEHPGLFRSKTSAGWGFDNGRNGAVVGLYKRPDHPDIPDNQIYRHDGSGAAGLSLSFKLGQ